MRIGRFVPSTFAVLTAVAFVLLGGVPCHAQIPESMEPSSIPNYRIVKPGLATAGQPSPEALKQLKTQGFKTVINLRTEAEGAKSEEDAAHGAGLDYVWVPVSPATFSLDDVKAVAKVLDDPAAAPVLLHCASANRVGAVWTVLQVHKGKSLDEAQAEGEKIGLNGAAMKDAVRRVLAEGQPK